MMLKKDHDIEKRSFGQTEKPREKGTEMKKKKKNFYSDKLKIMHH